MNCEQAQEMLPELLAGSLGRKAEQETLMHLAACAECRRDLAFWAQAAEAIRAETTTMPDGLFRDIRADLRQGRTLTLLETYKLTRGALGLAGSACKLVFAAAGIHS